MRLNVNISIAICFAVISTCPELSHAELSCLRITVKNKKLATTIVKTTGARCPKGTALLFDSRLLVGEKGPRGLAGSVGPTGAPGTDGLAGINGSEATDAVWGDGSAGDFTANSSFNLEETNRQFTNFTVNAGRTLTVASGTTIRATGQCLINGIISVSKGAKGGGVRTISTTSYGLGRQPANHGLAYGSPGVGEAGTSGEDPGVGGLGINSIQGRGLLKLNRIAYGSGGEAGIAGLSSGGDGGGGFALYCKGPLIVTGSIVADGANGLMTFGGGGGAGGLVVLASPHSITNTGTISAKGGRGSIAAVNVAPGGGGGGGIIHFLAPNIISGTTDISGGSAGTGMISPGFNPVRGGGGGGAFGGNGGRGAKASTILNDNAISGSGGQVYESLLDPSALLL